MRAMEQRQFAPFMPRQPLFGGYALVAVSLAWLAGIALEATDSLAGLRPVAWAGLFGGCGCATIWLRDHLAARPSGCSGWALAVRCPQALMRPGVS